MCSKSSLDQTPGLEAQSVFLLLFRRAEQNQLSENTSWGKSDGKISHRENEAKKSIYVRRHGLYEIWMTGKLAANSMQNIFDLRHDSRVSLYSRNQCPKSKCTYESDQGKRYCASPAPASNMIRIFRVEPSGSTAPPSTVFTSLSIWSRTNAVGMYSGCIASQGSTINHFDVCSTVKLVNQ